MRKSLTLAGAALVLSSSFAMAASQPSFNNLDSNANGVITKAEFDNQANKKARLSKNQITKANLWNQIDPDNEDGRNSDQ